MSKIVQFFSDPIMTLRSSRKSQSDKFWFLTEAADFLETLRKYEPYWDTIVAKDFEKTDRRMNYHMTNTFDVFAFALKRTIRGPWNSADENSLSSIERALTGLSRRREKIDTCSNQVIGSCNEMLNFGSKCFQFVVRHPDSDIVDHGKELRDLVQQAWNSIKIRLTYAQAWRDRRFKLCDTAIERLISSRNCMLQIKLGNDPLMLWLKNDENSHFDFTFRSFPGANSLNPFNSKREPSYLDVLDCIPWLPDLLIELFTSEPMQQWNFRSQLHSHRPRTRTQNECLLPPSTPSNVQ